MTGALLFTTGIRWMPPLLVQCLRLLLAPVPIFGGDLAGFQVGDRQVLRVADPASIAAEQVPQERAACRVSLLVYGEGDLRPRQVIPMSMDVCPDAMGYGEPLIEDFDLDGRVDLAVKTSVMWTSNCYRFGVYLRRRDEFATVRAMSALFQDVSDRIEVDRERGRLIVAGCGGSSFQIESEYAVHAASPKLVRVHQWSYENTPRGTIECDVDGQRSGGSWIVTGSAYCVDGVHAPNGLRLVRRARPEVFLRTGERRLAP